MGISFHKTACADLLADALLYTILELRLIDAGDLIAYIRDEQWANLADLIDSSSELSFKEGALAFSCMGEFSVDWDHTPSISLEMELRRPELSAFFTLKLGWRRSLVDLRHVWFAIEPADADEGTRLFGEVLAEARLPLAIPSWIFFER